MDLETVLWGGYLDVSGAFLTASIGLVWLLLDVGLLGLLKGERLK
jgi:hypothetical protein